MLHNMRLHHRKSRIGRGGDNPRILAYSAVFLLCALLLSLPSRADTQKVEGLDFSRIAAFGNIEVEVTQGDEMALFVKGRRSDLEQHPYYLNGDTLVLGRNQSQKNNFGNLRYKVTVVNLEQLQLSGSGEIYVKPLIVEDFYASVDGSGDIKLFGVRGGRDITLKVSGSGDIQVVELQGVEIKLLVSGSGDLHIGELTAQSVSASLSGSGDISIQGGGTTNELDINIVGSGDIDFEALEAQAVAVNIVGSGVARVNAVADLDVNIMGSGDVYCPGSPDVVSQSILGSGNVKLD